MFHIIPVGVGLVITYSIKVRIKLDKSKCSMEWIFEYSTRMQIIISNTYYYFSHAWQDLSCLQNARGRGAYFYHKTSYNLLFVFT